MNTRDLIATTTITGGGFHRARVYDRRDGRYCGACMHQHHTEAAGLACAQRLRAEVLSTARPPRSLLPEPGTVDLDVFRINAGVYWLTSGKGGKRDDLDPALAVAGAALAQLLIAEAFLGSAPPAWLCEAWGIDAAAGINLMGGGEPIWSVGQHKETGAVHAAHDTRYYQADGWRCLWLR